MTPAAQPRAHRRLGLALIIVASLLAFLSIFALWANRQFLNTDNWTNTSTKLLKNDAVRAQLSAYLVDQLYANVDVAGRLRAALPPRAQPLAAPAANALRQVAGQAINQFLQRPRAQRVWEDANRRAHKTLIHVIEGGGTVVSTKNGNVVLNLKALLSESESRVGIGGRAGEKLPADAAQLTILRSKQLSFVQDVVHLMKTIAIVLVALWLALFAVAVALARGWRRESLRAVGVGLIAAGAVALVARGLAGHAVVHSLVKTDSVRPAMDAVWSISTSLMVEAAVASIFYGVVIVLATWLAGPTHAAVVTRTALAPWLREPGWAYGGLAVIVLILLAWRPTPATRHLLPMLVLIGLLILGMEVLRRQIAREHPVVESREESLRRIRASISGLAGRGRDALGARGSADRDRIQQLERLGQLRDQGVLDPAEFEREKARIIGASQAGAG